MFINLKKIKNYIDNKANTKVDKSQGTENNGKFLKVNNDGNVACESVTIPSKTSQLTNDGDGTNVFIKEGDNRLSNARNPTSHTHDDRYYTETEIDTKLNTKTITVEKQGTAESGYAATYVVKQNNTQVGSKINIPKDFLVKSASLKTCTTANSPLTGLAVNDPYIDFTVNTIDGDGTDSHFYINVKDLVDTYTAGTGLNLTNGEFSVKYGTAAGTACQGNDSRLSNARTPTAHATTSTTYGGGTSSNYGHVKVSDNTSSSAGNASQSVAASSKAVKDIYDIANPLKTRYDGVYITQGDTQSTPFYRLFHIESNASHSSSSALYFEIYEITGMRYAKVGVYLRRNTSSSTAVTAEIIGGNWIPELYVAQGVTGATSTSKSYADIFWKMEGMIYARVKVVEDHLRQGTYTQLSPVQGGAETYTDLSSAATTLYHTAYAQTSSISYTVNANTIKKNNGTSSQFLKANGDIDSNVYIHTAGTGMIKSNNTLGIDDSGVGATQLASNAVETAKIANNAVTSAKIANGAVTNAKLSSERLIANAENIVDLNSIVKTGFYHCDSNINAPYIIHCPNSDGTATPYDNNKAFFLLVEDWTSNAYSCKQTLTYYHTNTTYIRTKTDTNTWGQWSIIKKDFDFNGMKGTDNTVGYVKALQLKVTDLYQDKPIAIKIFQRDRTETTVVQIKYNNSDTTDPTLQSIKHTGQNIDVYLYKSDTSTWELICSKGHAQKYGEMAVKIDNPNTGITITRMNTHVATLPASKIQSTYIGLDSKENTSNKVTSISSSSTNTQYPTAKAVYDLDVGIQNDFHVIDNNTETDYYCRFLRIVYGTATYTDAPINFTIHRRTYPKINISFQAKWTGNKYKIDNLYYDGAPHNVYVRLAADNTFDFYLKANAWSHFGISPITTHKDKVGKNITITKLSDMVTSVPASTTDNPRIQASLNPYYAPVSHASTGTGYGAGTASNYGHVKVIQNLTTDDGDGLALGAGQGKALKAAVDGKLSLSGGTLTGNVIFPDASNDTNNSAAGNIPWAGSPSWNTDIWTTLKNKKSGFVTVNDGSKWWNIISNRHRNGSGDGASYGMYIRTTLQDDGSLLWAKQKNASSFMDEKTILDSSNTSFTQTKTSGIEIAKIKINGTEQSIYQQDNNTTYSAATSSANGLLTSTDFNAIANLKAGKTYVTNIVDGSTSTTVSPYTDFNDYKTPGLYSNDSNTRTNKMSNTPWGSQPSNGQAFSLIVLKHAGIRQIVMPYHTTDPNIYVRNFYNNNWGSWYTFCHSGNLNNTVTSTSTTQAATANAVKTAYDKANSHSHGNINNDGTITTTESTANKVVVTDAENNITTINKLPAANIQGWSKIGTWGTQTDTNYYQVMYTNGQFIWLTLKTASATYNTSWSTNDHALQCGAAYRPPSNLYTTYLSNFNVRVTTDGKIQVATNSGSQAAEVYANFLYPYGLP